MRARTALILLLLGLMVPSLLLLELALGSTQVPLPEALADLFNGSRGEGISIVRDLRLPQALTAIIAGAGLAAGGLLMQTVFRNPLAGPSILGVSSGAGLGVALVMLALPLWSPLRLPADLALLVAALAGALGTLMVVMAADRRVGHPATLLIVGLLIGYLCSALVSVLEAAGTSTAVHGFVLWGMGSFAGVGMDRIPWLGVPVALGLVLALAAIKPLNALLLGEAYAFTMGVDAVLVRRALLWCTGIMAGAITAFCGPIAFIGLVTPHLARALLRTSHHGFLLPATILLGASLAMACDLVARTGIAGTVLPLNAVTSLLGVPVVAWVLFAGKRWSSAA